MNSCRAMQTIEFHITCLCSKYGYVLYESISHAAFVVYNYTLYHISMLARATYRYENSPDIHITKKMTSRAYVRIYNAARGQTRERRAASAPKTRSFCTAAAHAVLPPLAPSPAVSWGGTGGSHRTPTLSRGALEDKPQLTQALTMSMTITRHGPNRTTGQARPAVAQGTPT